MTYTEADAKLMTDAQIEARLHGSRRDEAYWKDLYQKKYNAGIAALKRSLLTHQNFVERAEAERLALENEQKNRYTTEPLTWHGVAHALTKGGYHHQSIGVMRTLPGYFNTSNRSSKHTVYVTFTDKTPEATITEACAVLARAGLTVRGVAGQEIRVCRLKPGQTLEQIQANEDAVMRYERRRSEQERARVAALPQA